MSSYDLLTNTLITFLLRRRRQPRETDREQWARTGLTSSLEQVLNLISFPSTERKWEETRQERKIPSINKRL